MLLSASSKIFQPRLIFPGKAGALAGSLVEVLVGVQTVALAGALARAIAREIGCALQEH
jgi:hypothetical protein